MKIVITDCDHPGIEEELAVAAQNGATVELRQCRTAEDVIQAGKGADGLVVQYAPITDAVLSALSQLKAVSRYGVGYDTVDVSAATRHGVIVSNVPDYSTEDVSDHAIALALALERGVVRFDRRMRAGQVSLTPVRPLHRTASRTFGIIGAGLIGSATARKASAIGYNVIAHDAGLVGDAVTQDGVPLLTLADVLAQADTLSLHVPLSQETRHLINDDTIGHMKRGAFLVNTCRGGVVDTDAVVRALTTGQLGGAGLDVFETEPLPPEHPLLTHENAILTPHVAWYSEESYRELKTRTMENVIEACAGRDPRNVVNKEVLA